MSPQIPKEVTPGRRLRLDRRKAGLSQEGLADVLGTTVKEVSEMENNRQPLSPQATAFCANPPSKVPPLDEPVPPADAPKPGDGPGPPRAADAPPQPRPEPKLPQPIDPGEIADLERALLVLFAGETFLVPREQPDGTTIQVEAMIPGLAQAVGMVDEFDGLIIRTYAPGMAKAWAQLARENPTVRKILFGITYGGAWRGVVAASLPAVLAITAHHGLLPLGGPREVVEHGGGQQNGGAPAEPVQEEPLFHVEQHDPPPSYT